MQISVYYADAITRHCEPNLGGLTALGQLAKYGRRCAETCPKTNVLSWLGPDRDGALVPLCRVANQLRTRVHQPQPP
jgi:hypothetical protein